MQDFQIILAAATSLILFVFGLDHFSKEIQKISGEKFRKFLGQATKVPGLGVLIGAVVTAFIQSSSATSVITISLVNAGVLSFESSLGIIFGANVGTTVTAQLVAFKLTAFAPVFIILGFLLSFIRSRYSVFAKTIFYFGFVFFSLNLISDSLSPLQTDARLVGFLTTHHNPFVGVLIGCLITAVIQSSSVTTGLAIIFAQQGLINLDNAITILMGANIGTASTALISIVNMDIAAKKTALAHFLFNFGGVILFLPFLDLFTRLSATLSSDPAIIVANFHLFFNLITTLVFLVAIKPFTRLIDGILGEGKMDFERLDLHLFKHEQDFVKIEKKLLEELGKTFAFVQENYNLVTLSIESNFRGVFEAAKKRVEYVEYLKAELMGFFARFIGNSTDEENISRLVKIMGLYEYIFQIHDSVKDIASIKDSLDQHYIELRSDILIIVRELSSETLTFFNLVAKACQSDEDKENLRQESAEFQKHLQEHNKAILRLMSQPDRRDAGTSLRLITYSQRLKDKLVNYHNLCEDFHLNMGQPSRHINGREEHPQISHRRT